MERGGPDDESWGEGWGDVERPFWPEERKARPSSGGRPYPGARFGRPIAGPGSVANFGARFWGFVIDWFVLLGLATAVRVAGRAAGIEWGAVGVLALASSAVYVVVAIGAFGRTLGQRAQGLEVMRLDGRHPNWGNAVRRWVLLGAIGVLGVLSGFPEVAAVVTLGVLAWMFVDRERQGLHDKVAGVIVVRAENLEAYDRQSWERR